MRRIPEEVIDEIRNQADIVDVIGNYVQLKKQGRNYIGLCPFHGEKTPSFSVSPDKQIFHCFGCGKGGNVFSFLMEHDNLPFVEAVRKVAKFSRIDVDLPEETESGNDEIGPFEKSSNDQQKMIEMHQLTAKLYHYLLMETDEGLQALEYLNERGLSEEMMTTFQIGYSPGHRTTIKTFLEKRGLDLHLAVESGILTQRDDGEIVDRFRNRIMFPITNDRGQQVGFSGRLFGESNGPKYLNSPETPIFNKRFLLYHFSEARQAIRKKEEVILLEGFMDVISTTEIGLDNGVASMGTSLTEEHIQILKRITNRAVICYDGDRAGIEATYKAGEMLTRQNRFKVAILELPGGKDPDEFIKANGADKFKEIYQHERMTWTAFKLKYLRREHNLQNEADQLNYINAALTEIAQLHQAVEREVYLKQLATEFDITVESLKQQMQDTLKNQKQLLQNSDALNPLAGLVPPEDYNYQETMLTFHPPVQKLEAHAVAERHLMKAMIENIDAFEQISPLIEEEPFYHDDFQALYTYLIGFYSEGNSASPTRFIDYLPQRELKNLVTSLEMIDMADDQSIEIYQDYMLSLKKFKLENKIKQKKAEQNIFVKERDEENMLRVTNEIIALQRDLKNGRY